MPDEGKAVYLKTKAKETVVTRAIDGYPQRVIRTPLVDALEKAGTLKALPLAVINALKLRHYTGTTFLGLVREGLAMRKNQGLSWSQLALAANAPMLTKASMVDGRTEVGILPTGQVTGIIEELPTVAELLERIMAEARDTLGRLNGEESEIAREGGAQ